MRPLIRPITKADVFAYRGEPYSASFRGLAVELNGEIVGVAGVLHTPVLQAFSNIRDELRKYPKTLVLAARKFREILAQYDDSPIYAIANENEKNAPGYLEYVGFEHYHDGVYRWPTR